MPITVTASNIAYLFKKDKANVLDFLYERYAGVLYGSILRSCSNKTIANKILINTFLSLKPSDFTDANNKSLVIVLLHYTKMITQQHCRENKLEVKATSVEDRHSFFDPLFFQAMSIKEFSEKSNIAEKDFPDRLRKAMADFRKPDQFDLSLVHTSA